MENTESSNRNKRRIAASNTKFPQPSQRDGVEVNFSETEHIDLNTWVKWGIGHRTLQQVCH